MDADARADGTESSIARDTAPAPPVDARPCFSLSEATLWAVTATCLPTAEGTERMGLVRYVMTADPSGAEVFAVVREQFRRELPGCRDIVIVKVDRCGDVKGTVTRARQIA